MNKGDLRRARKAARAAGKPLTGDLAVSVDQRGDRLDEGDRDRGAATWTESRAGYRARERWARWYDSLNGAPESVNDR